MSTLQNSHELLQRLFLTKIKLKLFTDNTFLFIQLQRELLDAIYILGSELSVTISADIFLEFLLCVVSPFVAAVDTVWMGPRSSEVTVKSP